MGFVFEERVSGSPYVETVMRGYAVGEGTQVRPAECHWHMVLVKLAGSPRLIVCGPLTTAGRVVFGEGAELIWIRLRLGVFMPDWPTYKLRDAETALPGAAADSFWLHGTAWQFPDYENVETFIAWLARQEVLLKDPLVDAAMQDRVAPQVSPRTLRHRFLQATGLTQGYIRQFERALRAEALLKLGTSILDTVYEAGYYDQPHLTRALKLFTGHTPAQILRASQGDCQTVQDNDWLNEYNPNVLINS
jgi:AraC-like DNA-binding protein